MPLETFAAPPAPPAPAPSFTQEVSAGSLIGRSFSTWWSNVLRFAAFTLLLFVPFLLVMVGFLGVGVFSGLMGGGGDPTAVLGQLMGNMVLMIAILVPLGLLCVLVQMGGLTYGGIQHLGGRPVRIGGMFSAGLGRALPLLGLGVVLFLVFVGAALVVGLVGGLLSALLGRWFTVVVAIVAAVFGVIVALGLTVAVPCVVAERTGPIDAIKRSWELTRGHRGSIFGAMIVLVLVQFGINLGAGFLNRLPLVGWVIALAVQLLVASLTSVLPAVAYNDLRMNKEGASTQDLARVFE